MRKLTALMLLGGSTGAAAKRLGCTPSAFRQWPEVLPRSLADRVIGARMRLEWEAIEPARVPPVMREFLGLPE